MTIKDVLHYGSGGLALLMGTIGMFDPHAIPGVTIDPATALVMGGGILGVGAKVDHVNAKVGAWLLAFATFVCSVMMAPAYAGDLLPIKAQPRAVIPSCTLAACNGAFIGGSFANSGGNFDVIGSGLTGLASNGLSIGGQAGLEFWNGQLYAAVYVRADDDISLHAPQSGISDKLTYGIGARVGYSLAGLFGGTVTGSNSPPVGLPQQLLAALMTPYINLGEMRRHGQPSFASGAGFEFLIATDWTANADYLRYTFNQGGTSGLASQKDENEFRFSFNKHFGRSFFGS